MSDDKLTPFPYQLEGIDFLSNRSKALLADEMGLGKTIQAILALDNLLAQKILIICPVIARVNWIDEFKVWSKLKRTYQNIQTYKDLPTADVVCCSFEYATEHSERLKKIRWHCLIIDEAHFLKSATAKRSSAILGRDGIITNAERCWLLTGTPAPNNASELWLMLFVFGVTKLKFESFVKKFCLTRRTSYGLKIEGSRKETVPELKKMLSKIMLRRLKKDVMKELPPISYYQTTVAPGEVELQDHASFLRYFYPVDNSNELVDELESQSVLLDTVFNNTNNNRANKLIALEAISDSVSTLRRYVGLQKVQPTIDMIVGYLTNFPLEKVVVFAIHRDVIEAIASALREEFKAVSVYGGTPPHKRVKKMRKFVENPRCRVFIGNIRAAGTAINLTVARKVIFAEADWVPGNNAQAVMRCHRIGQENKVIVTYVCLENSIDRHVMYMLKKKSKELTHIFDEKELQTIKESNK